MGAGEGEGAAAASGATPPPQLHSSLTGGQVLNAMGNPSAHAVVEPRMFYFPPDARERGLSGSSGVGRSTEKPRGYT